MARVKQAVFVRGDNIDDRYVWDYFHFHPTRTVATGVITLVYFDFPTGLRKTWRKWLPKNGSRPPGKPDEAVEIRKIDIKPPSADPATHKADMRATVLDLYDWVKKQESGSIIAFHVFSHGWQYGPVLWNDPVDARTPNDQPRSATDTEFRIRDFYGDNPLTGVELVKFDGSFSGDALIKLWGCNHQEETVALVRNFFTAEARKQADQIKAHLRDYVTVVEQTYVAHLAKALGRTVWAAPAGWGTDWARDDTTYRGAFPPDLDNGDRWWGPGPRFTKKHEAFFRNALKAKLDGSRHVGYNTAWVEGVKRAVAGGSAAASPVKSPRDLQQELLDQASALRL